MKTKLFTLLALTMLGLALGVTETKAQAQAPQNLKEVSKIKVREYPNPADETAFIEITLPQEIVGAATINILNMNGQVVYTEQCTDPLKSVHPVDVKLWPVGMYVVHMIYKSHTFATKFIVK